MEKERNSSSVNVVVSDVGAWGMNIISSVGIIMANKQLMSPSGFAFAFGQFLFLFFFSFLLLFVLIYYHIRFNNLLEPVNFSLALPKL